MAEALEGRRLLSVTPVIHTPYNTKAGGAVTISPGETLHVNALGDDTTATLMTTFGDLTDPLHTKVRWNFGDTTSSSEYNVLPGFNAAHIYAQAGTYTLTLTETSGGTTLSQNLTVVVSGGYDSQHTIYVAQSGTNGQPYLNGLSNTTTSTPTNLAALQPAGYKTGFQYLFKRGDTFTFTDFGTNGSYYAPIDLTHVSNATFGAYSTTGSTQPAIFDGHLMGQHYSGDYPPPNPLPSVYNVNTLEYINMSTQFGAGLNITFRDIRFDAVPQNGVPAPYPPTVTSVWGQRVTFLRCQYWHVNWGLDAGNQTTQGLLVQDTSTSPDPTEMLGSFVYTSATDAVMLGNTVVGSAKPENLIRSSPAAQNSGLGSYRVLIYGNQISDAQESGGGSATEKVDVGIQSGSYVEIAANSFAHANTSGSGPTDFVDAAPGRALLWEPDQYVIVENNYFNDGGFQTSGGAWHVAVRNNVFLQSSTSPTSTNSYAAIDILGFTDSLLGWDNNSQDGPFVLQGHNYDYIYGWTDMTPGQNNTSIALHGVQDLEVANNTVYQASTAGSTTGVAPTFLKLEVSEIYRPDASRPSNWVGITVENNLYNAPYLAVANAADVYVAPGDLTSFDTVASNVWQARSDGAPMYVGGTWYTVAGWDAQLQTGTASPPTDPTGGTGAAAPLAYGAPALDATHLTSPLGFTTTTSFTPLASLGALVDAGVAAPGVLTDFYGNTRLSGNVTIGAVQLPPPPPTNLSISVGTSSNTLSWAAVPPNGLGLSNVGYNIYGSNDGATWGTALNGATPVVGTSYADTRTTRNTYYKVTSADWGYAAGSSPQEHESTTGSTASTGSGSLSLWTSSDAPAGGAQNVFDSTAAADGGVELGIQISSSVAGYVNGVRFWKGTSNTGSHRAQLWSSAGQLLATATFTSETGSGWQQVNFNNPVLLTAGATYTVSYQATTGYLSYTPNSMGARSNGPLSTATSTNDWYSYDAVPGTPSVPAVTNGQVPNYWVDVVFTPAATVAGRNIFYNNSVWDGNDPTANAADDGAIAPDKQALLPGAGLASFANYTSFSKGINGIVIDVSNLHGVPTASDFIFNAGTTNTPSQWSAAPAPASVVVRPGAGTGGSTRVEVTWADYAITNEWLQVTLTADGSTLLRSSDVFYFANLVGETGKGATGGYFSVTSADEQSARNDPHSYLNPATITDVNDFNRDARVDATDQIIARNALGDSLVDLSV